MGTILIISLVVIAILLFVSVQKKWISDHFLQRLANIAGIVALIAAAAVFIVPAPVQPKTESVPDSSESIDMSSQDNKETDSVNMAPVQVLFEEDFEDGNAERFGYLDGGADSWEIMTDDTGNKVYEVNNLSGTRYPRIIFGQSNWKNYQAEYRVRILDSVGSRSQISLFFRSSPNHTTYDFTMQPFWKTFVVGYWSGSYKELASTPFHFTTGKWYVVKLQVQGPQIRGFVEDELIINLADSRRLEGNLGVSVGPGVHVQVDDIRVTVLEE